MRSLLAVMPLRSAEVHAVLSAAEDYALEWVVTERSVSTNTAAAGGNASLMSIG